MKRIAQYETIKLINQYPLLRKGVMYFIDHNTGISNPYHNVTHTMGMLQLVSECATHTKYKGDIEKLLLLALFHDFNHSGGRLTDEANVGNAISGLRYFLEQNRIKMADYPIETLWDTCFPYKGEPKTIEGKILRECDNLQWTFDDFFTQTLIGLKSELNVVSFDLAVRKEFEFVENAKKHLTLEYTQKVAEQYFPEFRAYCQELLKTL